MLTHKQHYVKNWIGRLRNFTGWSSGTEPSLSSKNYWSAQGLGHSPCVGQGNGVTTIESVLATSWSTIEVAVPDWISIDCAEADTLAAINPTILAAIK